ncbi:MAG: aspartate carbamoyltransferase catalytic subunit [Betaproteobacteria bacterium]|nr:aspartate carbamoyltransferase catalytic subunit [Betaproteobacteria bacterium]
MQIAPDGGLQHLITLEGLSKEFLGAFFASADRYKMDGGGRPLAGKLFVNIFFESSTRTRAAFEAAAKQLGADVVNLDQITMSGETKQESLEDTVRTMAAMGAAGIALRHSEAGAAERAAKVAGEFGVALINGGVGCESHPTQGLTDAYTLREIAGEDFSPLSVAIVGDVLHSRVARSNLQILRALGAKDIRLAGPPELCPPDLRKELGAPVFADLDEALDGVDVVMLLRVQRERLRGAFYYAPEKYFADYGLDETRLAKLKKTAVVMHPGPINRGVEISDAVADGAQSLILRQVANGMAVRKAVLTMLCARR